MIPSLSLWFVHVQAQGRSASGGHLYADIAKLLPTSYRSEVKAIEVSHDQPRPVFSSLLSLPQEWVPHLEVSWLVNTTAMHTWRRGAVVTGRVVAEKGLTTRVGRPRLRDGGKAACGTLPLCSIALAA
jgi:hypothetical protein